MERKWQLSVILGLHHTIEVTIPENCTTAELYDDLKKHDRAPKCHAFVLTSSEGELEISSKKRLSDYGIVDRGCLYLLVRVDGGVWPSVGDIEARSRLLKASESIKITRSEKYPDVFGLDDETPRAIMSCGHAVAPLALALHCHYELRKGEETIKCPESDCGSSWRFSQIREAACLSTEESYEFERKALLNRIQSKSQEIKSCPKCSTFCTRSNCIDRRIVCPNCTVSSGDQYEFCWMCLTQWKDNGAKRCGNPECGDNRELFYILATCTLKEVNGVCCPGKRACPNCFTPVEHVKGNKHMTCIGCKYGFCFICLKSYPCETAAWDACDVAPRQTSTESLKDKRHIWQRNFCDVVPRKTSAESQKRNVEHWQLFINYDSDIVLIVTSDCRVDELFRELYYHPKAPKVCGYRLMYGLEELDSTDRKRISQYGIQHLSNLQLVISLTGG